MKNLSLLIITLFIIAACAAISPCAVSATSVNRTDFCDLKGSPGETLTCHVTLTSDDTGTRSGYWDVYYKSVESDGPGMDITSWINIEPREYALNAGQSAEFTIIINISRNASSGLWGAVSPEAGLPGRSAERRTYIVFRDALPDGNVYSGMLIPVAVQVLNQPAPLVLVIDFISNNIVVTALSAVIIILIILLVIIKKPGNNRPRAE